MYLNSLLLLFVYFVLFFLLAQKKQNNGLVDIAWGLGFVVLAGYNYIFTPFDWRASILLVMILLWGGRLTYHLFLRNWNKPEDYRYQEMRAKWGERQQWGAFISVFMSQMLLMYIIAAPILLIMNNPVELGMLDYFGVSLWIVGYFFEVVGDYQLKRFINNPQNKGKLMTSGLWRYTRHPNYFGEGLMWIGIGVMALSVPYGYLGLVSPILINYMLLYVSGVPLLEEKMQENPEFAEYKKRTNRFIPGPVRRK